MKTMREVVKGLLVASVSWAIVATAFLLPSRRPPPITGRCYGPDSRCARASAASRSIHARRLLMDGAEQRASQATPPSVTMQSSQPPSGGGGGDDRIYPAHTRQKTFSRFIEVESWKHPEVAVLEPVMRGIESACKGIATLVRRAQCDEIQGIHGSSGDTNVQGEVQKVMDVLANRILIASMCTPGKMDYVASEEEEEPTYCSVFLENAAFRGDYAGVFDPLDGSSNIEAGLPVGTIFGIYRRPSLTAPGSETSPIDAIMQPGKELLAAGYCLYGGQTILVCTVGHGVHGFTLNPSTQEFILTHPSIKIPNKGKIYSMNEGNSLKWDPRLQDFVRDMKTGRATSCADGRPYTATYVGAMVADVHNVLMEGGLYGYPGTVSKKEGKIRLLYEANPMSMLIEKAGGLGSTGLDRILDLKPSSIHQRVPTFIGSRDTIQELCSYMQRPYPAEEGSLGPG